jgi:hypothetical protein
VVSLFSTYLQIFNNKFQLPTRLCMLKFSFPLSVYFFRAVFRNCRPPVSVSLASSCRWCRGSSGWRAAGRKFGSAYNAVLVPTVVSQVSGQRSRLRTRIRAVFNSRYTSQGLVKLIVKYLSVMCMVYERTSTVSVGPEDTVQLIPGLAVARESDGSAHCVS